MLELQQWLMNDQKKETKKQMKRMIKAQEDTNDHLENYKGFDKQIS